MKFLFRQLAILAWIGWVNTQASGYWAQDSNDQLFGSSFGFPGTDQTFDYVIVGGGTSGLTVAKRLAENQALSIAVVEAGGFYEIDAGNFTQIPALETLYLNAPPNIDWGIYTTPQTQLLGQRIHYTQGKCMGGSSGRNGMAYQRGTTGSYQMWADQVDDQSYTLPNLMPYFQKSCKFTPPDYSKRGGPTVQYDPEAFSASGGPLNVAFWNHYIPVSDYIRQGLEKLGFKEQRGINSGSLLGYAQYPAALNPDSQIRDSSETSFGQIAIRSGDNLQIYQQTLAKKILFSGKSATGVTVQTAGITYTLSARKEVVLAAGPFRTPQLLMVSGIGPQTTLNGLNIPVVSALEGVGQNFWDQPGFGTVFPVNVTTQTQLFNGNSTYVSEAYKDYITSRNGSLSMFASNYIAWEKLPNSTNITASARADLDKFPSDWPDLEYILNTVGYISNTTQNYLAVGVVLMKATSRGNVTINSTDTANNPIVNVNWLYTKTDQELAVEAVRRARIIEASWGISDGPELAPGPSIQTDAEILQFIKSTVGPSHHAVASCKMGRANDPTAVVDSRGRVVGGVSGLRIVDASAMALLPPGQPMSTVYMLAEKLAADILQDSSPSGYYS